MSAKARTKTEAAYLLSERRKDEMLRECLQAFEALRNAGTARNLLRLMDVPAYNFPQDTLAGHMAYKVRKLLGEEK